MVLPRVFTDCSPAFTPGIMWTHTRGKEAAPPVEWTPNHFVILVPDEVSLLNVSLNYTMNSSFRNASVIDPFVDASRILLKGFPYESGRGAFDK